MNEYKLVKSFDGTKIYYRINKLRNKPALFFLHGASSNHTIWGRYLEYFGGRYTTVAMDFRAHGYSESRNLSLSNMADDIYFVMKKEGIDKAALIGNSLGASAAMIFAERYGGNADKIILVYPFFSQVVRNKSFVYFLTILGSIMGFFAGKRTRYFDYGRDNSFINNYIPVKSYKSIEWKAYVHLTRELMKFKPKIHNNGKTYFICAESDLIASTRKMKKLLDGNTRVLKGDHLIVTRKPHVLIEEIKKILGEK